jgi:LysR family transcriptional regulator, hydrogen peroxide-inducible genes activator
MELHQLRYFVAVAETGSFTRAADRCGVAQPSLSQQIQKLEKQLRQQLFDRLGRGVLLTEAGKTLLGRATSILSSVDETERSLRDGMEPGTGRLAVGAIPTIAPYLLPPVISKFLRRYPGIELHLQEDLTPHLLEALREGEIDLAVMSSAIVDEHYRVEKMRSESLLVTLPRRHRLARKRKLSLGDLKDERFILLSELHCLGQQVTGYCQQHDFAPRVACRSAQIATMQRLIELGLGISLLPALTRDADLSSRRVYRELAEDPPSRPLNAVWHRQRYQSPTARLFLQQLRMTLDNM